MNAKYTLVKRIMRVIYAIVRLNGRTRSILTRFTVEVVAPVDGRDTRVVCWLLSC